MPFEYASCTTRYETNEVNLTHAAQSVERLTSAMLLPAHHWQITPEMSSASPTRPVMSRTRLAYPSSHPTCKAHLKLAISSHVQAHLFTRRAPAASVQIHALGASLVLFCRAHILPELLFLPLAAALNPVCNSRPCLVPHAAFEMTECNCIACC